MQDGSEPANNAGATKQLQRCIGDNIRQARTCQGMSLADVGHALAIEESVLANYEAGLEKVSPMMLCKIAVSLDTTLGSLFGMSVL